MIQRLLLTLLLTTLALGVQAASFEKLLMPGKVIEGHAKYEEKCESCHQDFDKSSQRKLCLDCHEKVAADISAKQGYHGLDSRAAKAECRTCHTDHKGREVDIVLLDKERFDHKLTDFPLEGGHQGRSCGLCHAPDKRYREAPGECLDCHKQDDRHAGSMGEECADCHTVERWNKTKYDHSKTRFPLAGKHADTTCASCHPGERYKLFEAGQVAVRMVVVEGESVERVEACAACHRLNDVHAGRFGEQCQQCHDSEEWKKSSFNHDKQSAWRLTGKHRISVKETARACNACHAGNYLQKAGTDWPKHHRAARDCIACHRNDDEHRGRNGSDCKACHSTEKWTESGFDHNRDTKFRLTGKHEKAQCRSCHRADPKKEKLKKDCYSCHAVEDIHKGTLGRKCAECHNTNGWTSRVQFDHELGNFPLVGQHAVAPCEACHLDTNYEQTPKACNECHGSDDVHEGVLGEACDVCHNPNDWRLWQFDHDRQTDWTLEGAHAGLICGACHTESVVERQRGSNRECIDCHLGDDRHNGGFGRDCGRCHNSEHFNEIRIGR